MLETIKKFKIQIIIVTLLLAISIPLTLMQVSKQQQNKSKASASPVSLILNPLTGSHAVSSTFDVDLNMNTGTNNATAIDTKITYDPDKLTLLSFIPTATFPSTIINDTATAGTIHYVGVNVENTPITGPAIKVGTLKFTGKAVGSATVGFSDIQVTGLGETTLLTIDTENTKNGTYTITDAGNPPPENTQGETQIKIAFMFPGIAASTDPRLGFNNSPKHPEIPVRVKVFNSQGQEVGTEKTGNASISANMDYRGTISLGNSFPTGTNSYSVFIKTKNSLWKRLSGIQTITGGQVNDFSANPPKLVTGDQDDNGKLTLEDYAKVLGCVPQPPNNTPRDATCVGGKEDLADINDDGKVDEKDINILLGGFAQREGDL